jgi:hypothetical protein
MVAELEEVPMSIVGGLDIHRKQLTYDWVDEQNGKRERGRITPADREHLASRLTRFDAMAQGPVAFALEGCTGWRYVAEEMRKAGVDPHLAEPADISVLSGPKRRAKTDKADAKLLRELLAADRLPQCYIPDPQVLEGGPCSSSTVAGAVVMVVVDRRPGRWVVGGVLAGHQRCPGRRGHMEVHHDRRGRLAALPLDAPRLCGAVLNCRPVDLPPAPTPAASASSEDDARRRLREMLPCGAARPVPGMPPLPSTVCFAIKLRHHPNIKRKSWRPVRYHASLGDIYVTAEGQVRRSRASPN